MPRMRFGPTCVGLAALCPAVPALAQPMCLAGVGATLYRVNAGAVETFPNQSGEIVGLTVVPPGVAVAGCGEGDIIGVENLDGGRMWRVDHARSGTPNLVQIGRMPAAIGVCDIAFAHARLFGISWGAVFYEFDLST